MNIDETMLIFFLSANDFLRNPNFSVDLLVDSNKQSHFSRTSADQMGEDNSYSVT